MALLNAPSPQPSPADAGEGVQAIVTGTRCASAHINS